MMDIISWDKGYTKKRNQPWLTLVCSNLPLILFLEPMHALYCWIGECEGRLFHIYHTSAHWPQTEYLCKAVSYFQRIIQIWISQPLQLIKTLCCWPVNWDVGKGKINNHIMLSEDFVWVWSDAGCCPDWNQSEICKITVWDNQTRWKCNDQIRV